MLKIQMNVNYKRLSPSNKSPRPPRILPSPLPFPPAFGADAITRSASRLNGNDCIYTLPGPSSFGKKQTFAAENRIL